MIFSRCRRKATSVWSVGQFTVMAPDESGVLQERQGNFANIYQWEGDGLKFRVQYGLQFPAPTPSVMGPYPKGRRALGILPRRFENRP